MRRILDARRAAVVAGSILLALGIAIPVSANQGAGSVSVQATNNAAITLSISDDTAYFGSTIDPMGTNSNSSDANQVRALVDTPGSYYVWRSSGGNGLTVTVKSNTSWVGTMSASENDGGSRSMTIHSDVLRYSASEPTSYYDAALAPAFGADGSTFERSGTKGIHDYTYFYALRVDWNDDPGTFQSNVTYSVTN